ncbi:HlyD family secretion protein [Pseudoduganella sp. UC29_106]|uniref:HlyD family secretion protein n=1 Tax=Pseudoduganella sp. UC29_106 TaxID=3374553 RepID=UPI00375820D3
MHLPLFRKEVLEERAGRWAGAIVLQQPVPVRLAAAVSALLALALTAYLMTGHYTRRVTVSGRIVPADGAIKVVAPQFGRVVARSVREGDQVEEGQVLYELSSERSTKDGAIERRVSAALDQRRALIEQESHMQIRQLQQRLADLGQRGQLLKDESEVLTRDERLQLKRVALAESALRRFQALRERGFVSELQLTQTESELAEQQSRLQASERGRLATARELALATADEAQAASQIELVKLQAARALATLEQEAAEQQGRGGVRVLAPAAGFVTALSAEQGESVAAGAALATIVPKASRLEAHLQAPSNAIGFVAEGQAVRLRIAAFPFQKFGYMTGRVRSVDRGPITETAAGAQGRVEAVYRIAVSLDRQTVAAYGQQRPLRTGMALEADIKQDRRRLIEWLFDPVKSVAAPATTL